MGQTRKEGGGRGRARLLPYLLLQSVWLFAASNGRDR